MATNNALNLKTQGVTYYNGTGTFSGVDGSTSGFVLTSAQIKAIRATPIQIIAAPGAGKVIMPVNVYYYYVYAGTNAFTNGQIIAPRTVNGATLTGLFEWGLPAASLNGTTSQTMFSGVNPTGAQTTSTDVINKAVVMINLGASEITGNAANDNTLEVAIVYYIWTL